MDISAQISELKNKLSEENLKGHPNNNVIASLTKEIEKLEVTQIPFTVSARTARLIGQENFANAEGAIIELVKNSYDADASVCVIIIDPILDNLYIFDNGHGMTRDTILKNWMTIGTDDKKINFKTKSRVKTGAKGIGRFALDRLGQKCQMLTKTEKTECIYWDVDWGQFEKQSAVISDIKATIWEQEGFSFPHEVLRILKSFGLDTKVGVDWENKHSTLLNILSLRDTWDEKAIESLYSNLEILVPPTETNEFEIFLYSTLEPDRYGKILSKICDDYDYKLIANVSENQSVKINIYRNEWNVTDLIRGGFFEKTNLNQPQYQKLIFETGEFEIETTLEKLIAGYKNNNKNNNLSKIGAFTFTFYYLKRGGGQEKDEDIKKFPVKSVNYSVRANWLNQFGGIKIFRDYFRVRPYGETKSSSFDWLDLGKRVLKNPTVTRKGYKVGPQQVYGIINISRIDNINFEDKSSREGLQENDTFTLFKEIIKSIIGFFENDRNQIMMSLKAIYDETEAKRIAQAAADKIIEENNSPKKNQTDEEKQLEKETLIKALEAYKEDVEELQDEQKILKVLASAGLIVTSFAHEFKNHADSILPRFFELKEALDEVVDKNKLEKLPPFRSPFLMIERIRKQDLRLKSWLDFSILSVRKDKRSSKVINMVNYIEELENVWSSLLSRSNIKLTINKQKFLEVRFKGFEIDLDSIFNNLLVNSVDAFKRSDSNDDREITISFSINFNDKLGISTIYEDNGPGLLDEILDPDKIFEPFFTTKRDENTGEAIGTGLGMAIVKSTIDSYNGEIEIIRPRPNFKIKISLPHN